MSIDVKIIGKSSRSITFAAKPVLHASHGMVFANLNKRDKSKVFGKNDKYVESKGTVLAEDIFHGLGCDLFGNTVYKIQIVVSPMEDKNAKQKKTRKKEEA